jgi:hypothetical protein
MFLRNIEISRTTRSYNPENAVFIVTAVRVSNPAFKVMFAKVSTTKSRKLLLLVDSAVIELCYARLVC